MKITLIAHKYSLKVKMLYITRHCLIFFCIQGLIRVLIYVTLSQKQTLFQWALYTGVSCDSLRDERFFDETFQKRIHQTSKPEFASCLI